MHAPIPSTARFALAPDGTIEGYASLFGAIDQARDMVMPGAFTQTLKQRGVRSVPMLFQHDPAEPVGVWLDLKEDFRGLYARGRLIPDVTRGRELLALLRNGAIDGLSIGYRTVRGRIDPRSRVRALHQVDLWEISIVTFSLLDGARVMAVKDASLLRSQASLLRSQASLSRPQSPLSQPRAQAERDWQAALSGSYRDTPTPRCPPRIAHLNQRAGRKTALRDVAGAC